MTKAGDTMMNHHLIEQSIEDAEFMLANGASIEEAAHRLGISVNTLEKRMERDA